MEAAIGVSLISGIMWLLLRPVPKRAVNPQHWAMPHNQQACSPVDWGSLGKLRQ